MGGILVVEDSPGTLFLLPAAREPARQEALELPNREGLPNALAEVRPDRLLLDIQLTGKDWFTSLRALRERAAGNLLVVALTAHAMAGKRATD